MNRHPQNRGSCRRSKIAWTLAAVGLGVSCVLLSFAAQAVAADGSYGSYDWRSAPSAGATSASQALWAVSGPGVAPGVFGPGSYGPVGGAIGAAGGSVPGSPGLPSGAGRSGSASPINVPEAVYGRPFRGMTDVGPPQSPEPIMVPPPERAISVPIGRPETSPGSLQGTYDYRSGSMRERSGRGIVPTPPTPGIGPSTSTSPRSIDAPIPGLPPVTMDARLGKARGTVMEMQLGLAALANMETGRTRELAQQMVLQSSSLFGDLTMRREDEANRAFGERLSQARATVNYMEGTLTSLSGYVAGPALAYVDNAQDRLDRLSSQLDAISLAQASGKTSMTNATPPQNAAKRPNGTLR